jgi:anthranilate synthase component 1
MSTDQFLATNKKSLPATVTPGLERYRQLADAGYRYIPICSEQLNDTETPVTLFAKLTEDEGRFLLESVEQGKQVGRYSFIGWKPLLTFKATGNQLSVIEQKGSSTINGEPLTGIEKTLNALRVSPLPDFTPFYGGAVGYIGYDYVRHIQKLPAKNPSLIGLPELIMVVPTCLIRFDHVSHKITTIVLSRVDRGDIEGSYEKTLRELARINRGFTRKLRLGPIPNAETTGKRPLQSTSLLPSQFADGVARIKESIKRGEVSQVVLSQRISQEYAGDPFFFYRVLRTVNPSPYLYYLDFGDHQLAGSSPEMMVRLEDGRVTLKPIAGTRRRGSSASEDQRLCQELLADEKERSEHMILVDLGRNELNQVCRSESIRVTDLMTVEFYSHVMHIVSTLQGELLPAYSGFDLLRAVFPAGTLSGAPKRRAMEMIELLEPTRREFYGGCVGYLGFNGNLDTCITIRTVLFQKRKAHFQVGAGIVAGSDPEKEYEETLNKAEAILTALARTGTEGRWNRP